MIESLHHTHFLTLIDNACTLSPGTPPSPLLFLKEPAVLIFKIFGNQHFNESNGPCDGLEGVGAAEIKRTYERRAAIELK